ncbi:MAG: A/G-specific adenine glycosylase [Oscillospiraceae bacterium]|nr:A/G-specific adenine glycosylase [Oscillospiraceae bacterium]
MKDQKPIAAPLLAWFEQNRRSLPFRDDPTPYHIWVSEIMLQQTRMTAAVPYYLRFMARLPTVQALAQCPEEELTKLWEGLGYYSRMRNLQKAARLVCSQYGGSLPASFEELKKLPGVGEYTAGAIASIGFGLPAPAVDGNVLRVFSRLWRDETDISTPAAKALCAARVMACQPPDAPGDFNQALMELGALVCLPGAPNCPACPLQAHCAAFGTPDAARLPVKAPKPEKKLCPVTLVLARQGGRWLLCRRPKGGLLAGLWQPPLWEQPLTRQEAAARLEELGFKVEMAGPLPASSHKFTHLEWKMNGWQCEVAGPAPEGWVFAAPEEITARYALPGALKAYKKIMAQP